MKFALALAALLGSSAAQAADLTCNFSTPVGDISAVLADGGQGFDNISLNLNGEKIGTSRCMAENSFRRSTLRCGAIIDSESRVEFYRTYFPRRDPQVKYSMIVWTKLSSNSPRVETIDGQCE